VQHPKHTFLKCAPNLKKNTEQQREIENLALMVHYCVARVVMLHPASHNCWQIAKAHWSKNQSLNRKGRERKEESVNRMAFENRIDQATLPATLLHDQETTQAHVSLSENIGQLGWTLKHTGLCEYE